MAMIDGFGAILLAIATTIVPSDAATTVAPSDAVTPAPGRVPADPTALREIGRVRVTTPFCVGLLEDASRAVAMETDSDRRLTVLEDTLNAVDLDSNVLVKKNGTQEIDRQYVAFRASAATGVAAMKHFRQSAGVASTPEQRNDLLAFADALDGALQRQKRLADQVGRLIAYLDAHQPLDKDTHDRMLFNVIASYNDHRQPLTLFDPRHDGPAAAVPDMLTTTAKNAAGELVTNAAPIAGDEDAAASRIDNAFKRC